MEGLYYVTATDSFLSGWGRALGKINKLVIECESYEEAETVQEKLERRSDMSHVNICITEPRYNNSKYYTSYITKEDQPGWYM